MSGFGLVNKRHGKEAKKDEISKHCHSYPMAYVLLSNIGKKKCQLNIYLTKSLYIYDNLNNHPMYYSIDGMFQKEVLPEKQRMNVIKSYIKKIKEDSRNKKRS